MTTKLCVAAVALLLPLGGCSITTPAVAPAAPAPVVVQQPTPSTGTVVVQPQP